MIRDDYDAVPGKPQKPTRVYRIRRNPEDQSASQGWRNGAAAVRIEIDPRTGKPIRAKSKRTAAELSGGER